MDKNQAIKNIDVDSTFLSLSLNERLYLNDTGLYSKSGFNIYRPQAQKLETSFYQESKQNSNHSLQQIDQAKYQALNGPGSQRKTTEDLELVRNKLEVVHNSVNNLRNQVAQLQETVNKNNIINKDQQTFCEKFENFILKLPSDIDSAIKKTVYDVVERTIDHKIDAHIKHAETKTKIYSCKKLDSFKKSKINKYHLLNRLKNYKNLVLNENGVRKRRTIVQTDVKNFSNSMNDKYEISSTQESVDSLFEFEM